MEDIPNDKIKKRISEMSFQMGGGEYKNVHRFEYDERGQVVRVYFNDSLYIERVFKDANIIRYQCYFPDPTFIEPPVLVEVSLNSSGKIHDIFNFNDFFSSAYGVDNLPVYIGVSPR